MARLKKTTNFCRQIRKTNARKWYIYFRSGIKIYAVVKTKSIQEWIMYIGSRAFLYRTPRFSRPAFHEAFAVLALMIPCALNSGASGWFMTRAGRVSFPWLLATTRKTPQNFCTLFFTKWSSTGKSWKTNWLQTGRTHALNWQHAKHLAQHFFFFNPRPWLLSRNRQLGLSQLKNRLKNLAAAPWIRKREVAAAVSLNLYSRAKCFSKIDVLRTSWSLIEHEGRQQEHIRS